MNPPTERATRLAFLAAAFASGCGALLNQVLWSRVLSLAFGSTMEAVAAVTATFMGGLALGGAFGPRFVRGAGPRTASTLYVRIETGLAIFAMVLAFLLPLLEEVRASAGAFVAWSLAFAALLAPTTLMGATLVMQTHALSASGDTRASRVGGWLFAANTFGAVVACYVSVLFLIPAFGVRRTIFVAAACHAMAALGALRFTPPEGAFRQAPTEPFESPGEASRERRNDRGKRRSDSSDAALDPRGIWPVLAGLLIAGFCGLANEVAWTRAFVLIVGPTVHAFAFVLGAIVLGLATGALASASLLVRLPNPGFLFVGLQAGVSIASALVARSIADLPLRYGEDVRRLLDNPEALLQLQAMRAIALLAPVAALSGALFPVGLRLLSNRHTPAEAVGIASAVNTAGAIAGSLLAGFVALPAIGLDKTLAVIIALSGSAALLVAATRQGMTRIAGVVLAGIAVACAFVTRPFDKELFAGGVYKYSAYDPFLAVEDVLRRGELVFYEEGRIASVSVKRIGSSHALAVDGKVDATSGGDMLTQRLLAHVPFAIANQPKTALVIGLGSGVTAHAAATHAPDAVTAVEISPEVVTAAERFFADVNGGVLKDPRVRLVTGDARQHVLSTRERYDVVISEPSNPWMAGVSALFTREFFEMVKARLSPGGVFCQWGHLYNMSERDLKTLLATFTDVFPNARVFVISEADILIVGGAVTPVMTAERLERFPEAARVDLERSGLRPVALRFIPSRALAEISSWLDDAKRHTDDAPILDFRAPLSLHAQTASSNRRRLVPNDSVANIEELEARLAFLTASESPEWIYDLGIAALNDGRLTERLARELLRAAVQLRRTDAIETAFASRIATSPGADLYSTRALLYWNTERPDLAMADLERATKADPSKPRAFLLAVEIQLAAGNLPAARKLLARVFAADPRNLEAIALAAETELRDGRLEPASRLAAGALLGNPQEPKALEVQALSLAQLGRLQEARSAFEKLIGANPDDPGPRNNLGVFELNQGNAVAAARAFKDAVDLDPSNLMGYTGLKEAAMKAGRHDLLALADRGLARLRP